MIKRLAAMLLRPKPDRVTVVKTRWQAKPSINDDLHKRLAAEIAKGAGK